VLWYGARLVLSGTLTSGALVVFMLYLRKLYSPLKDLAKMTNTFSRAAVGLEAIQEVMQEREQASERADAIQAHNLSGKIEFDHVDFGYTPERLAVTDVSLTIEAGAGCRIRRPDRRWKDDHHQLDSALLRRVVRSNPHRW
jgi:subfamily B ATP-binding cassette protein MsbA